MTWTNPKMLEEAKRLWAKGKSASAIARQLSSKYGVHLTRNSVLGKLHRVGVPRRSDEANRQSMRAGGRKAARASARARFGESAKDSRPVRLPPIEPDPSDIARKTFDEITDRDCKFIVGEVGTPDYGFCGDKALLGLSWCHKHAERVFENHVAVISRLKEKEKATECIQHD